MAMVGTAQEPRRRYPCIVRYSAVMAAGWNAPKLFRKSSRRVAYVVRVDLQHMKPPVWRRLRVASDMALPQFKDVVLAAMSWSGGHLHQFTMGTSGKSWQSDPFVTPWMVSEGYEGVPEADVRLDQVLKHPGDRIYLDYDFGDGWVHTIRLEKIEPWDQGAPDAVCLAGRRACPPEDIGGPWGFEELLEWFEGKIAPEDRVRAAELAEWLPEGYDPKFFSVAETNEVLEAVLSGEDDGPGEYWEF